MQADVILKEPSLIGAPPPLWRTRVGGPGGGLPTPPRTSLFRALRKIPPVRCFSPFEMITMRRRQKSKPRIERGILCFMRALQFNVE